MPRHIKGSRLTDTSEGLKYIERVSVEVVANTDFAQSGKDALDDASVPQRFSTFVIGTSPNDVTLTCGDRSVVNVGDLDNGNVLVIIEVTWSEQVTIIGGIPPDDDGDAITTVGAVVEIVETEFDKNGDEITVQRNSTSPEIIQPVQYRRPAPILESSRYEVSSPRTRAETFVGKLNSLSWNGYAAETVLCTGIVGTTRDRGVSYDVRYSFEYKPNGWTTTVVFIDEDTGRPIANLVDNESKKTIDLYDAVSFSSLNITL